MNIDAFFKFSKNSQKTLDKLVAEGKINAKKAQEWQRRIDEEKIDEVNFWDLLLEDYEIATKLLLLSTFEKCLLNVDNKSKSFATSKLIIMDIKTFLHFKYSQRGSSFILTQGFYCNLNASDFQILISQLRTPFNK